MQVRVKEVVAGHAAVTRVEVADQQHGRGFSCHLPRFMTDRIARRDAKWAPLLPFPSLRIEIDFLIDVGWLEKFRTRLRQIEGRQVSWLDRMACVGSLRHDPYSFVGRRPCR